MRTFLISLTIASLLGQTATERICGYRAKQPKPTGSVLGEESTRRPVPAVAAEENERAPLFHRKSDESSGGGNLVFSAGSMLAVRLSGALKRCSRAFAAATPAQFDARPTVHLRI